jgi:hypothetical protein
MKVRLILLLIFTCALSQVVSPAQNRNGRNWTTKDDSVWTWNWSEDGNSLEMSIRGDVEFTDDYTNVKRLGPGSSITIREKRAGTNRRLEIEAGSGTGLAFSYFVDGQSQPYDAAAKAWFVRVLADAVTQSGLDAKPRAQRILKERGVGGLLDEISRLKNDHVKHLYFQELLENGGLDARSAPQVLNRASREMTSDHYKAQVLMKLPEHLHRDEAVRTAYLAAAASLKSDHYRAQTLSAALKRGNLSKDDLLMALKGAAGISSDHYKTQILIKAAESSLDDRAVRSAFVETALTVGSDHYRTQALSAALGGTPSTEALLMGLRGASAISSDHYKVQVLNKVAEHSIDDNAVRSAFAETVATIDSDHYRAQALSLLLKKGANSKETLLSALRAAGRLSDHYKAQLLLRVAAEHGGDETVRTALIEAARTIKSDHERGRVLSAIFK